MLQELLIILAITYGGNLAKHLLNIPLPGLIVGMLALFISLKTGLLKLKSIEKTGDFILGNMLILFLPAMVKVIEYMEILKGDFFKILILLIVTTIIVMGVTAKVVHYLIVWKEKR